MRSFLAVCLVLLVGISNDCRADTATDKVRRQLSTDPSLGLDEYVIRDKVFSLVQRGWLRVDVDKKMKAYGLVTATPATPTPCTPGDRGLLCVFRSDSASASRSEPEYWIEFVYDGVNRLEDVVVTRFQKDLVHPYSTEDLRPGNYSKVKLQKGLGLGSTVGDFEDVYGKGEVIHAAPRGWPLGRLFELGGGQRIYVGVNVRRMSLDEYRDVRRAPEKLRRYKVELIL